MCLSCCIFLDFPGAPSGQFPLLFFYTSVRLWFLVVVGQEVVRTDGFKGKILLCLQPRLLIKAYVTWRVVSDLSNRQDTGWNWRLVNEMCWCLEDSSEIWQGSTFDVVHCCNFVRFRIYVLVSVIIYLIQRRRYFMFCIVPRSALQLERLLPALVWDSPQKLKEGIFWEL